MGGHKKSYCIKLLHLALALSLLHVDPDSFLLQQRLRNWDSQLEFSHGNGWELEMLRAVPMVPPEYPYANRKSMLPLIEDLVLYDRERETEQLRTDWNVTAYHLLSDGLGSGNGVLSNQNASTNTANVQDIQVPVANTAATLSSPIIDNENLTRVTRNDTGVPTLDLFLNSDMLQDQRSLWEQNLADLHDFGDLPASNVYTNLPLKDDPEASYNGNFLDINLEPFLLGFDGLHNLLDGAQAAGASNGSFPLPSDNPYIKLERIEDNENVTALNDTNDTRNLSTNSSKESETEESGIKQEQAAEEENAQAVLPEVDLSSFINVNSIKEESEIVEVLWKQDVDLGYSLTPRALNEAESKSASKHSEENEEYEKLKALNNPDKVEDDKNFDFTNGDLDNDWSGIPFTIDNETGEYIRLPLEEIFKDVLQLEGFDTNTTSADNSLTADLVGASTSQAAVTANNALEKEVKVQIQNESEEQEITLKELVENSSGIEDSSEDKDNNFGEKSSETEPKTSESGLEFDFDCDLQSPLFDLDDEAKEELAQFDMMIQSNFHHHSPHGHAGRSPAAMQNYAVGGGVNSAFHRQTSATGFHHGHHQGRLPLSRSVSMEQHLQDIASLFNPMPNMGMPDMPSYAAYAPHPYSYQSAGPQHAQYPPPPPPPHARHPSHATHHSMLHPNGLNDICAPPQPHYGHNLGSAVTSSMHLTNPIHEDNVGLSASGGVPNAYKMEHDMNYYSNTSSEMNHTADGFINSILNDEDLHLMDMNVNNDFCRMVDVNSTSNNSTIGHMNVASGGAVNTGMTADMLSGPHSQVTGSTTGIGTAGDRLDASSDSAVSSMGSERVPSLSDGEWGEGSDSAQDYHAGKYGGPYDYSYNNNTATAHNRHRDVNERQPPVAQKKHQMFGKRYLNEQNSTPSVVAQPPVAAQSLLHVAPAPVKYEYKPYDVGVVPPMSNANLPHAQAQAQAQAQNHTDLQHGYDLKYPSVGVAPYSLDFSLRSPRNPHDIVQHNHTYSLPQGSGSLPRPQQRDKKNGGGTSAGKAAKLNGNSCAANNTHEDEHLTRDEKRARALNIPITVNDIINLPMDEFNERLSKYDLNENQLSLIRDIRRRGKNKVAAQNCRKRKLDQILSLEDEVKEVRRRKEHLQHQHDELYVERKRISNKFAALHRHIFQYLRDPEGNPCSATDYSLQLATDGSVYLLPRDSSNVSEAIAPITAAPGSVRAQQVAVQNHAHHQHLQQQQQQQQQAASLNGVMHASQQQQQQQQQQPSHHQVPPKE